MSQEDSRAPTKHSLECLKGSRNQLVALRNVTRRVDVRRCRVSARQYRAGARERRVNTATAAPISKKFENNHHSLRFCVRNDENAFRWDGIGVSNDFKGSNCGENQGIGQHPSTIALYGHKELVVRCLILPRVRCDTHYPNVEGGNEVQVGRKKEKSPETKNENTPQLLAGQKGVRECSQKCKKKNKGQGE
ncbi:hypothetical protein C8R44DRAFT_753233 [Mycena epipterygia]|nr:hypothetical protein C8R44DRAFT_753233 [Mycena epipterygia]